MAPRRALTWRTAPPLVSDGLVWATPRDGDRLLVLDLARGVLRASVPAADLKALAPTEAKLEVSYLAGVAGQLVFLGGNGVAAFEREGDLDKPGAWHFRWAHAGERFGLRAGLRDDEVLVQDAAGLASLDQVTGEERARYPLRDLLGLAVTDSELIGLDRKGLVTSTR